MKNKKISTLKIFKFEDVKIERILVITFTVCFCLLIISQLLMQDSNMRMFLTQEEAVEGAFLDKSNGMYDKGLIVLEIETCDNMEDTWVLVNGQKVTCFKKSQLSLSVKHNDLIEIDGTKANDVFRANITSCSENVRLLIDNSGMEINKNIAVLARVKLK